MKKVVINKDKCLGCGMCVGIENDVFDFLLPQLKL